MSLENYSINTRQKALEAARQANAVTDQHAPGNEIFPGVVVAVNGGGYDVATLDANGNQGRIYRRIHCHPSSATFTANDEVWLWLKQDEATPLIFAGGGGSGGCLVATTAWGVLFG